MSFPWPVPPLKSFPSVRGLSPLQLHPMMPVPLFPFYGFDQATPPVVSITRKAVDGDELEVKFRDGACYCGACLEGDESDSNVSRNSYSTNTSMEPSSNETQTGSNAPVHGDDATAASALLSWTRTTTSVQRVAKKEMKWPRSRKESRTLDYVTVTTRSRTGAVRRRAVPKRYLCDQCPKRFHQRSNLLTHLRTHTGEKPFVCPHENCGRKFTQSSNLRRHLQVHERD
jgi:hypothetical protein